MSVYQWPREPLQDARWRSDTCRHKHRTREAAERCERQEWGRRAKLHEVTIRRVYEISCETCGWVIGAEYVRATAEQVKRKHIEAHQIT